MSRLIYKQFCSASIYETLGKKVADDSSLIYDNVPVGALLWLRNLSRGKQERIFTYEEGRQVWW